MRSSSIESIVVWYRSYRIPQGIDTIELISIFLPSLNQRASPSNTQKSKGYQNPSILSPLDTPLPSSWEVIKKIFFRKFTMFAIARFVVLSCARTALVNYFGRFRLFSAVNSENFPNYVRISISF